MTLKPGFPFRARQSLRALLQHVLVEECSLCRQTLEFRGQMRGPHCHSLTRLFEDQRRQIDYWLGELTRCTRAVGLSSVSDILARGAAPAVVGGDGVSPPVAMTTLLERHEEISRRLRADLSGIGDPPTVDLLQRLAEFHETSAWLLRLVVQGAGRP